MPFSTLLKNGDMFSEYFHHERKASLRENLLQKKARLIQWKVTQANGHNYILNTSNVMVSSFTTEHSIAFQMPERLKKEERKKRNEI